MRVVQAIRGALMGCCMMLALSVPVHAGEERLISGDSHIGLWSLADGDILIKINGQIVSGDAKAFSDLLSPSNPSPLLVRLNSEGGAEYASIDIGRAIKRAGLVTAVAPGDYCLSACALIWLAGKHRILSPFSFVVFHSAIDSKDEEHADAQGNVMAGIFFGELGIPYRVAEKLIGHGPDDWYIIKNDTPDVDCQLFGFKPPSSDGTGL
jgi:hypothetical protein